MWKHKRTQSLGWCGLDESWLLSVHLQSESLSACRRGRCIAWRVLVFTTVTCSWQETGPFSPSASLSTKRRRSGPPPRWCPPRRTRARRLPPRWSRTAPSPAARTPSVGQREKNKWQSTFCWTARLQHAQCFDFQWRILHFYTDSLTKVSQFSQCAMYCIRSEWHW